MMKSKKPRRIVLKNPKLRKIRSSLREILRLAYYDYSEKLLDLRGLYNDKNMQKGLTPSQDKRHTVLIREKAALDQAFAKSICICFNGAACHSYQEAVKDGAIEPSERPIDLDMVWVPEPEPGTIGEYWTPTGGAWFCLKCHEVVREIDFDDFEYLDYL
ncbi:MAG: hypothetical protein V3V33_07220 [Candidatus Lokiarchaeia archaeon]